MTPKFIRQSWVAAALVLSVCVTLAQAQQRTGGGNRSTSSNRSSNRSGGGGGSSSSGSRDYNNNTMVGDATISADLETRRLIVVTDEDTALNISQVVSNLDRPKPQVLIKVVFMEVTHNDDLDVGLEASYTKNIGGTPAGLNVGATNIFGLVQQGASGGSVMPYGAGLYSIAGDNFRATLRAIQANGKSEVLSRPSVMVRNNQPANITVGERIPIITSTQYNNISGPVSSYNYLDIGIILQVTPFITQDGLVQLIVAPEISDLTDQSIAVSTGVNIPVISTRSANTVVVTPDGIPVVIGGLMGKSKKTIKSQIPLLGDIPGLGILFKRKQTYETKTELVIFLTPYVVRSPGEMTTAVAKEAGHLDMAPKSFSEKELDKFLEGVPLKKADPKDKKEKE